MNEKWFESSTGNGKLSLSIKGALLALLPLVMMVYKFYGLEFPQQEVEQAIIQISATLSSLMMIYGLLRKLYYAITSKAE